LISDVTVQMETLKEGILDLFSERELKDRLDQAMAAQRPLRVKYGVDPSFPDLHLGHTVPLRKLRVFQELGHRVVFIIGDFTARIGDPSGRSETRKMLTGDEVMRNAETYQQQVFRILDREKTEVRYNSEWLAKMDPGDFLTLASKYTVARMLERDDFQKRYASKQPIALIEFLYPLLQGYDSVRVAADVEIGGTDQVFNLLVGRELQKDAGQMPQVVMTLPLLEGTDGVQKMSKSYGNTILLEDAPREIFGKIMSVPDRMLPVYYRYVSGLPLREVQSILESVEMGTIHPREAKARLAERIVTLYHGEGAGAASRREFDLVFREKGVPGEIPEVFLPGASYDIVSLLKEAGLVASKNEGRRLVEQGGVKVDQNKLSDPYQIIALDVPVLIQCGKRKFAKVRHHA